MRGILLWLIGIPIPIIILLLAGLLILGLLAGSAIFVTYFWPVFEIAAPQVNMPTPAVQQ